MQLEGVLTKMKTEWAQPIQYYLIFESNFLHVNQLLDKPISLQFLGYQCLNCNENKEIYRQGFCRNCFFEIPQSADWVIKPELSKAHLGIEERDLAYEQQMQLQPHIVYLANSSSVKVGVTRKSQIPTRWIDQGAHEAIAFLEVPNRYLAGVAEVALKQFVADKTNWRNMLKNNLKDEDLKQWCEDLKNNLPEEVKGYYTHNKQETVIQFPVLQYPEKPKSLNLIKQENFEGILKGIKGQYLIFNNDYVFNVRSNEGLKIAIRVH